MSGRVQGVCYRVFCQEMAEKLSLTGWVRNLPDGKVELDVQGEEPDINSLCERLNEGPPLARVSDVQITVGGSTNEETSFNIVY